MAKEIWRKVVEYEGLYKVSNFGRVKSIAKNYILKLYFNDRGYHFVRLSKNNTPKMRTVHRIVAKTFKRYNPLFPEVNHLDGVKTNNATSNLEWCNRRQNIIHAYKNGLKSNKCENHPSSKISNIEAKEIFESTLTRQQLSEKYKVSTSTINLIKSGKVWSNITGKKYERKKIKLSRKDVLYIFNSAAPYSLLEDKYGISQSYISGIKTGKDCAFITGKVLVRKKRLDEGTIKLIYNSTLPYKEIKRVTSASYSAISQIKNGKTWLNITKDK